MGDKADDSSSVRVAVRVRPQLAKERIDMCQVCTAVSPDTPQVTIGKDKSFTFDHVFDIDTQQEKVYQNCSRELIDGTFDGYNATVFAYGQTGSGKTYTMGTGFEVGTGDIAIGIVPRAVEHLFNGIDKRRKDAVDNGEPPPDFKVNAQFMELYNEEIHDLLDTTRDAADKGKKSHIKIHEDAGGGIYCVGVTTRPVHSYQDTMQCLQIGALCRTTASTNMNAQSSRSHAIFTLHIRQTRLVKEEIPQEDGKETDTTEIVNEFETLTAKFHFVDLAGSERLKRTGATGDRAKEGISINCGLLALGNVISALGDVMKMGCHVPYRDSKLTRLLQDSLGGNSRTVMIACVSPSDRDFMETLNTLKYANRARNIQNKVSVNQDKTSKQISMLRTEIVSLQSELLEYKAGKRLVGEDGVETINDMFHENTMLQTENNNLRERIKSLQETIDQLRNRNVQLLAERDAMGIANLGGETANEEVQKLIQGYIKEIEELRTKLMEAEATNEHLRRSHQSRPHSRMTPGIPMTTVPGIDTTFMDTEANELIDIARREILAEKKLLRKNRPKSSKKKHENEKENENETEENKNRLNEEDDEEGFVEDNVEIEDDNDDDEDEEEEELNNSDSDQDEDPMDIDDSDDEDDDFDEDELMIGAIARAYKHTENLHEDLANLTCDISIKQKLIEQLEGSQKRLQAMKSQYEDKLMSLQSRIKETEAERDTVLASLGDIESHSQEKVQKVKGEYEKKLNSMTGELKKVQAAKKEHAKLLKNQTHYEKQLKTLQKDLSEMKKFKVKLMNQIKEATTKNRQLELRNNKQTAQLKKEQRLLEGQMQKLQSEKRQKEIVLKRKVEEIESLKNRERKPMSAKAAGRVGSYAKPPTKPVQVFTSQITRRRKKSEFSPKAAKHKWDNLERSITAIITKRQTVTHMERDMDRWLKERETKSKKIDRVLKKKQRATDENKTEAEIQPLTDQLGQLRADIAFIQDNIKDCQAGIMQMEESKQDHEQDPTELFSQCNSLEEAKYLLEHFLNLVISKGLQAAQKDTENKELIAKLHQENVNSTLQRDMLQYLIVNQTGIEIDESLVRDQGDDESDDSDSEEDETSCSDTEHTSTIDRMLEAGVPQGSSTPLSQPDVLMQELRKMQGSTQGSSDSLKDSTFIKGQIKARRKIGTPEELLYAGAPTVGSGEGASIPTPLQPVPETPEDGKDKVVNGLIPEVSVMPPPKTIPLSSRGKTARPPTAGEPLGTRVENGPKKPSPSPSPSLGGRKGIKSTEPSPAMRRKATGQISPSGQTSSSLSIQSSVGDQIDSTTPPGSPSSGRRGAKTGNVFSRLTRNGGAPSSPHPSSSADDSVTEDDPTSPTSPRTPTTTKSTDINHNRTSAGPTNPRAQRRSDTVTKDKTPTTPTPRRKILGSTNERKTPARKVEKRSLSAVSTDRKTDKKSSNSTEKKPVENKSNFTRTGSLRDSRNTPERKNFNRTGSMIDRSRKTATSSTTTAANRSTSPIKRALSSPNPDKHSITATGSANRSISSNQPKSPGPTRRVINSKTSPQTQSGASTSSSAIINRSKSRDRTKAVSSTTTGIDSTRQRSKTPSRQSVKQSVPINVTPPSSPRLSKKSSNSSIGSEGSGGKGSHHGSGEFYRRFTPITRGVINPASGRHLKNTPLIHAFTAAGHSKAVLHIHATDDLMFSASKDKTAKIWDLGSGEEVLTLDGHPSNVNHVKFCEYTQVVVTTCAYFMKIWDLREGNKCIRTITSAGQISDGSLSFDSISRQIACPPGEAYINDIALNTTGSVLYSAAGNTVKIWDLRNYKAVGKLSGGHQAQIMTLAVDDTDTADGNICVVTGSKDHYIKVFELMEDSVGVITPKYTLEPPHYDGIQSLCLMGDLLFSGSRDTCIKKWDLADQQLQQSINNAHKDWVKGLAFMPGGNCLVSGCRTGAIKLWHIDSCTQLGEMRAHNSQINHITTNNSLIFTASDERYIKLWYPCWDNLPSSVMDPDCLELYI